MFRTESRTHTYDRYIVTNKIMNPAEVSSDQKVLTEAVFAKTKMNKE